MSIFSKPKFKRNSKVRTPDGYGEVWSISFDSGINWYEVRLDANRVTKFYAESELNER
jgi:hypothetical protein